MISLLEAALLGVVQGLTEFLPVSSTAHLLIGGRLLGFDDPGGVFTTMIQAGSILAIMWLYRERIVDIGRNFRSSAAARRFVAGIAVATVPALLAGALLSGFVKTVLYASIATIATSFVLGGVVMLAVERYRGTPSVRQADQTPIGTALGIGLCQTLALIPGVSRSGATIVGGMLLGLDRAAAAEFSFFLAMPTLLAAFAHDLLEARHHMTGARALDIAVGFLLTFVASVLVVKPFLGLVRRSGFARFAWYRIVAGVALFAALAARWL